MVKAPAVAWSLSNDATVSQDFVRQLPGEGLVARRKTGLGDVLHLDFPMVFLLLAISLYGLLVLYSAVGQQSEPVIAQGIKILVGIGVMVVIAQISPIFYRRLAPFIFLAGLALLGLVFFIGTEIKGSRVVWIIATTTFDETFQHFQGEFISLLEPGGSLLRLRSL